VSNILNLRHSVLPGFRLSFGITLFWLALIVLLPFAALVYSTMGMGWDGFLAAVGSERVMASIRLSFATAGLSALINLVFGFLVAWVLVRYPFPGKRLVDALVDLPFALPTAVAGIALTTLYAPNGWIGQFLVPLGIKVSFTPLGIIVALTFIGLPFVVRTVQPVLEDLEKELEEAATCLGASRWDIFRRVIFPATLPSLITGGTMGLCPCDRRIRLGHLHCRQYSAGVGNRPADHRLQAGSVRPAGGHCGGAGDAGHFLCLPVVDQPDPVVGCTPPRGRTLSGVLHG